MISQPLFRQIYLHPKYWPTWFLVFFINLLTYLPVTWQMSLGKHLGRLLLVFKWKRVQIAAHNIALCFPESTEDERKKLLRLNMEESGKALFDTANAWCWSDDKVQKYTEICGEEYIRKAEKQGRGVILFFVHSMTLEIGGRALGLFKKCVGVYRPHNNAFFEYLQIKGRLRSNKGLIPKNSPRDIIKALRAGEVVWYSIDQAPSKKSAIFVPFFAVKQVATVGATTKLAKLGKAVVCPIFVERRSNGKYRIEIAPPLENFPGNSTRDDTIRLSKLAENLVHRKPEQYLWVHRRFKASPDISYI